jgi:hypothetical protein
MIDIDKQVDYWRSGAREDWAVAEGIRVVDDAVMVAVRKYLTALRAHGLPVQLGVIFGSQATGTAGTWSDISGTGETLTCCGIWLRGWTTGSSRCRVAPSSGAMTA